MRRSLHLLARAATAAVAAATAALFLAVGVGPLTGRYLPYTILTTSMTPTAPAGSVVFVVRTDAATLEVGDVITYRIPVEDRRIVTHRIVEIVEPGPEPTVTTQGDANDAPDPWSARLVGGAAWRMQFAVPGLGYLLRALQHPTVLTLSRTALPAITAAVWLAAIWSQRTEPTEDRQPTAPSGAAYVTFTARGGQRP